MSEFASYFLFDRPVINFKPLDELFQNEKEGHCQVLLNLHYEIKELITTTLFSKAKVEKIQQFLDNNSSLLELMNLQSIYTLLLSIMEAYKTDADRRYIEEFYSQLYYQIYHVLEAIRFKINEKVET